MWRVAVVALAACTTGHVELASPPAQLAPSQRLELFAKLAPAAAEYDQTEKCDGGRMIARCTRRRVLARLVLGNGETIEHAEDLLPVVRDDSETADHARSARLAKRLRTAVSFGGLTLVALGGTLWYSSRSDDAHGITTALRSGTTRWILAPASASASTGSRRFPAITSS